MRNVILGSGEKDDAITRVAIARPTASIASQFVYNMQTNIETARVALGRIPYAAARAQAFGASDEQLQGVIEACRDVEAALAAAIAKLTVSA